MKLLLTLLLTTTFMFAGSIDSFAQKLSYETSYATALAKAKEQKKPILLIQVSNYCPWCKKLEKRVLASDKVNSVVQKNYIPLVLNRDKREYPEQFYTPIVPVSYLIDYKDDSKFKMLRGYQGKNDFLYFIK